MSAIAYIADHIGAMVAIAIIAMLSLLIYLPTVRGFRKCASCKQYGKGTVSVESSASWGERKGWIITTVTSCPCPHCGFIHETSCSRPATTTEAARFG